MIQTCTELLQAYRQRRRVLKAEKLTFLGDFRQRRVQHRGTNLCRREWFIPARVEPRETEYSEVMFFRQAGSAWVLAEDIPFLSLQDPFWVRIHGEVILGGVEVFPHPTKQGCPRLADQVLPRAGLNQLEALRLRT